MAGFFLSLLLAVWQFRTESLRAPRGISANKAEYTPGTESGTGERSVTCTVRNDGPMPLRIVSISPSNGPRLPFPSTYEAFRKYQKDPIRTPGPSNFLAPGGHLTIQIAEEAFEIRDSDGSSSILNSIEVHFTDTWGRRWAYLEGYLRRMKGDGSQVPRRHLFFETRRWFEWAEDNISFRLSKKAAKRKTKRPPRLVYVINWLWGWRGQSTFSSPFPINAPWAWHWIFLMEPDDYLKPKPSTNHSNRKCGNFIHTVFTRKRNNHALD